MRFRFATIPGSIVPTAFLMTWVGVAPALAAGAASVLPPAAAVKGWKQVGAPRSYDRNTLFQLIDGGAEAVLQYRFVSCAHGEYGPATQTKPAVTFDVYDMSDPLNAFGQFSDDRLSGKPLAVGTEGVKIGTPGRESGLNFWKGRYVVRSAIVGPVNPPTQAAQLALARAIAARIPGTSAMPAAVQALPAGRQPHSEQYILKNAAGHPFLTNAISARYPSMGQGAQLFISACASPSAAKSALDQFRQFETKNGTGLVRVKGVGEAGFSVSDKYAKSVVAVQKGRNLIYVIRAREPAVALNLVKQAAARVH